MKQEQEQDLISRLLQLQLNDPDNSGFIRFDDFDAILHNFSLHSSKFLMDFMISELQVNEEGMVEYNKSVRLCGDLLKGKTHTHTHTQHNTTHSLSLIAGSLTFNEFQALMEQVELGISSQELRFVISEADENENGVTSWITRSLFHWLSILFNPSVHVILPRRSIVSKT